MNERRDRRDRPANGRRNRGGGHYSPPEGPRSDSRPRDRAPDGAPEVRREAPRDDGEARDNRGNPDDRGNRANPGNRTNPVARDDRGNRDDRFKRDDRPTRDDRGNRETRDRSDRDRSDRGGSGGSGGGGVGRHARRDRWRGNRNGGGVGGGEREAALADYLDSIPADDLRAAPRVRGILEVLREGSGFLRIAENNYLPGNSDIYVPRPLIDRWHIREGSDLVGPALPLPNSNRGPALCLVDRINNKPPADHAESPWFRDLVVIDPIERFNIEQPGEDLSTRVVDLFAPIGRGQRALIVAPPRSGKTVLLQGLANAIALHHPDVHLLMVLIDERPEEVTDMRRKVKGEVIASSLDRITSGHVRVAEIVLERARRLVEIGRDVVILLDSLTRLARAYNRENPGSGRTLTGGLDARTMEKPREFFGAARNVEGGGSLTIIATALVDTGSRMDQVIFEEFKGTGNMELILDRSVADRRIYPAIDINSSGTRKEEKLRMKDELDRVFRLRRSIASYKPVEAMELLLPRLRKTRSNPEFLMMLG